MKSDDLLARQDKLRLAMNTAGLDAVLLSSGVSIRYYTGFTSDESMGLLTSEGCWLITDFRYGIQAKEQVCGAATVLEVNQHANQLEALRSKMEQASCRRCGYEEQGLTVAEFQEFCGFPVEWQAFGSKIAAPRMVKAANEVESLKKAQAIADKAYLKLLAEVTPGMTEREIAARLNYICASLGSEAPSFDPIVGSGPNGAMCHAVPGQRKIAPGDLVVVDFGCVVDGYHSDMTRTFGVSRADAELVKAYAIVREAQLRCLDAIRAGITGAQLDGIARDYIAANGYGDCFGHGLGHGFGLEIHEPPRAGQSSEDVLEAGMTVTVEPGIYLEGKGGVRIEDCVVVTDTGCMNLVSSAKDLLFI